MSVRQPTATLALSPDPSAPATSAAGRPQALTFPELFGLPAVVDITTAAVLLALA